MIDVTRRGPGFHVRIRGVHAAQVGVDIGMTLTREEARDLRSKLVAELAEESPLERAAREVIVEADFMLSGGDAPAERCGECGLAGEGMLRDALRKLRQLVPPWREERSSIEASERAESAGFRSALLEVAAKLRFLRRSEQQDAEAARAYNAALDDVGRCVRRLMPRDSKPDNGPG